MIFKIRCNYKTDIIHLYVIVMRAVDRALVTDQLFTSLAVIDERIFMMDTVTILDIE